jgi:Predicted RNA-binding protein (contains KH domain)
MLETPARPPAETYVKLIRFLLQPLLERSDSLRVHAEVNGTRVWLRVAIAQTDRAKVLGKGGKTMQTVRTVLHAAAKNLGHTLTLELYEAGRN